MSGQFSRLPPRAAGDRALSLTDLRVLVALGQHIDATGTGYPGLKLLSKLTGIHRRNVQAATDNLEAKGYIRRERTRRGAGYGRTYYTVVFEAEDSPPEEGQGSVPTHATQTPPDSARVAFPHTPPVAFPHMPPVACPHTPEQPIEQPIEQKEG